MLKVRVKSKEIVSKLNLSGKRITLLALRVLSHNFVAFSFKERNKTLKEIDETNMHFFN